MQFAVPQFIESEGKIFAFLTVRQFVICLLTAGMVIVLIASNIPLIAMFSLIILVLGAGISLAFVKINGQLFNEFVLQLFGYIGKPAVRVWRKEIPTQESILKEERDAQKYAPEKVQMAVAKRQLNKRSLSQLSLIVDTGGAYKQEN